MAGPNSGNHIAPLLAAVSLRLSQESQARELAKSEIPDDPWEFCVKCVWTQDEHGIAKGVGSVRQFPDKAYLRGIVRVWEKERMMRIEKSRQLMVTWLMAALHVWAVVKNRGERVAWQSKKFEDADNMLRDRLWFIFLHIPENFSRPRARYVSGGIEVYHDKVGQIPTSQVMAVAQGPDQLRQYTFSRIFSDEFAFQERQDESYAAMRPTIDGGGRLTVVSSANFEDFFFELGHKAL